MRWEVGKKNFGLCQKFPKISVLFGLGVFNKEQNLNPSGFSANQTITLINVEYIDNFIQIMMTNKTEWRTVVSIL